MVYNIGDLKHLELMASLKENSAAETSTTTQVIKAEDSSLTGTLLKLCSKLRSEGFGKYADTLEDKFVIYRAAGVHLYRAHDEDGEDLIERAHPDGDVNMGEASDNNGDVETILSKHKKIVDVIQKVPTGKLAAYVEQCKIALGQQIGDVDSLYQQASENFDKFKKVYLGIAEKLGEGPDYNSSLFNAIQRVLDNNNVYSSHDVEDLLVDALDGIKTDKAPGFFDNSEEKDKWTNEILPMFDLAMPYANTFKTAIANIRKLESTAKTEKVKQQYSQETNPNATNTQPTRKPIDLDAVDQSLQSLLAKVTQLSTAANASNANNKQQQVQWLAKMNGYITRNQKELTPEDIAEINKKLDEFKTATNIG